LYCNKSYEIFDLTNIYPLGNNKILGLYIPFDIKPTLLRELGSLGFVPLESLINPGNFFITYGPKLVL
jgi:hypothetical protein